MTILFLHGWQSVPGGIKPTYLKDHGHTVINPALPDDSFPEAVRIAQAEFDKHQPQVVVGSSRGGAVAMNIDSGEAKLVLLCPAWRKYGTARTVKPDTVILHSRADDVVPFADSEALARTSGATLIEVGSDHRLADPEPLEMMLRACEGRAGASVTNADGESDPEQLLELLRGNASTQQFRRFAIACCRRIWTHLSPVCRASVEVAQKIADGSGDDQQRKETSRAVNEECIYVDDASSAEDRLKGFAAEAVLSAVFGDDDCPAIEFYATNCAIAAARATIEVVAAECEMNGGSEAACFGAARRERAWQRQAIQEMFAEVMQQITGFHGRM